MRRRLAIMAAIATGLLVACLAMAIALVGGEQRASQVARAQVTSPQAEASQATSPQAEVSQATSPQAEASQDASPQVEASQASAEVERTSVERGQVVYAEQKCRVCHSIAGVGSRRYPLDGVGSRLSRDDIRKWIVSPREMNPKVSKPGFDTLPQADLEALVAYVSSL